MEYKLCLLSPLWSQSKSEGNSNIAVILYYYQYFTIDMIRNR